MITKQKVPLTLKQAASAIRKTWRGGRKTIELDGLKYSLRRLDKPVVFVSGGQTVKRTESWILANRVDGELVPVYNVELEKDGNLRSVKPMPVPDES